MVLSGIFLLTFLYVAPFVAALAGLTWWAAGGTFWRLLAMMPGALIVVALGVALFLYLIHQVPTDWTDALGITMEDGCTK